MPDLNKIVIFIVIVFNVHILYFLGLLSSIYYAQKAKDIAMEDRLKVTLEERNAAIHELEELITILSKLVEIKQTFIFNYDINLYLRFINMYFICNFILSYKFFFC